MAQPTTSHPAPMQHQAATHGVSQTPASMAPPGGAPAQTKDTAPAEPVLFEDIDPILLARLYPAALAKGAGEARSLAEAAGHAAHDAGAKLQAAAQEPIAEAPAQPPPSH